MHQRERKTGYFKRDERCRSEKAFASICKIALLLILFSCAHRFDPKELENPSKTLTNSVKKFCISGEGRGQITQGFRQLAFSFEALLKKNRWMIAVNLPLHGEEVLIVEDRGDKSAKISGSLSKKLRGSKKLFRFFNKILKLKDGSCHATRANESSISGLCDGIKTIINPRELRLSKGPYYLSATQAVSNYFTQVELGMVQPGKKTVKMKLSLENCSSTQ